MKWILFTLFTASQLMAHAASTDLRLQELRDDKRAWVQKLGAATAAMVHKENLVPSDMGYVANYRTLRDKNYCKDFSLSKQVSLSECSGALISDRHILTAGHCADLKDMCRRFKWVFDYHLNDFGKIPNSFLDHQVYSCKKIVASVNAKTDFGPLGRVYQTFFHTDFAIIELDRPVMDREPVRLTSQEKVMEGSTVFSISYPLGMPAKISLEGEVDSAMNTNSYFWTNLTVFGGSSGGPIFDSASGDLVGVISKGLPTTERDRQRGCVYELPPEEVTSSGQINANTQMKRILKTIKDKKIPAIIK